MDFTGKRLYIELAKMTTVQLKGAINAGLNELEVAVTEKPKDWENDVVLIGNTMSILQAELERRDNIKV